MRVYKWLFIALILSFQVTGTKAAELSLDDQESVARVEAYLNEITTLKARFLQINAEGQYARGTVLINRPGRARFEYDPPAQILVVADGTWLVFHDKELEETNRIPLYSTPISVILKEKVELKGDVTVTSVEKDGGILRINIIDTDEPDQGGLTLVFTLAPFELRKWLVTDAQGSTTSVAISEVEEGLSFEPKLFVLTDPSYD
ncbi:LolA family protein [Sneathiella glossodoripedis]|uniref:LolA family protein n=1 Tax=Sneathiella glossodoripedis TaxID=418853 RepID=UPI000472E06F|nr:outer membrane lipoprotein carrier protein LolA [Sneathiella glossodoripedis]